MLLNQLLFDKQAHKVYCDKYNDRESAMYHQKLQWKTDYHLKAKMVAKAFQQRYIRVCAAGKLQAVLGEQQDFQRQIQTQETWALCKG